MTDNFKYVGAAALVLCSVANAAAAPAYDLRCERLVEPVAIDRKQPRLSWKLPDGVEGQSAYRLLVADSTRQLARHEGSLWDSGKVSSDQSHLMPYFHYGLGGLRPDPEQPGFKHFVLAPQVLHGLASAGIEHESPYGLIESKWEQSDGTWIWQVRVPPNSTATVQLPHGDRTESAQLSGSKIDPAASQTLPAGTWRFMIKKTEFANQP